MALMAAQVSLSVSGARLLESVDVAVEPGKVTTVLGPNGAGKTSLLRVLSGELAPDSGSVQIEDRALRSTAAEYRARRLAVLPQHSALNFPFSVVEVVLLGRIPHDTGVSRDTEIVAEALETVDCAHLAEREYTRLSGGEKQRVHLARVLAQIWEPQDEGDRYLLLDEPTSSFDLAHQHISLEIVRRLAQQGVGVLMVLHDLNLAARCADTVLFMRDGSIAAQGEPGAVLTPGMIEQVFDVPALVQQHPERGTPLVIT